MAYPRRLLNDHETVVVDLHPHWWSLVRPVVLLLVAIGLGIAVLMVTEPETTVRTVAAWACIGLLAAGVCWLVARYLAWVTTNFVITTHRVIDRSGVLTKRSIEIPLERVNTVSSSQHLFERLVGVGDLVVESGSEYGQQRFADLRNPGRIQRVLHGLVHERQHASAGGGRERLDVAGQLERFEGMLQRGTLTQDEFDAQKQRLLDQL